MKKQLVVMLAAFLGVCCLSGCGNSTQQEEVKETVQESGDSAILVVSFGTSYNDSRDITIGGIENAIAAAFPETEVRRAFTSQIIIDKLKERDSLEIDNVEEALDRAVADGIKELTVQPTHLMDGYEYHDLAKELSEYRDKFDKIILSTPLLMKDADFDAVIAAITEKTASYDDGQTAICFMGHGTEAESNGIYAKFQEKLAQGGYENYYIGTVEAAPTLEDVIAQLKEKGSYKRVVLEPLMVVAGDHANNDMAGAEEDSWKSILEKEGYEVECVLEGLGQISSIQNLYVDHAKAAVADGVSFEGVEEEKQEEVSAIEDGTYQIEVESDSPMFKVEKAEVTIEEGAMTAVLTLSGTGYSMLFMGTGEQAAAAEEAEYINYVEDGEGAYTYTIPVEALDKPISCAAFSKKKEEWYDRQLTFLAASLTVAKSALADGVYNIDVTLGGGSGKTTISSPASISVQGDAVVATIQWSSPSYDYMLVGGEKYLPVNTEGDSVFEIPVLAFDEEMPVTADTIAMSKAHEIEYTLIFHSETMTAAK